MPVFLFFPKLIVLRSSSQNTAKAAYRPIAPPLFLICKSCTNTKAAASVGAHNYSNPTNLKVSSVLSLLSNFDKSVSLPQNSPLKNNDGTHFLPEISVNCFSSFNASSWFILSSSIKWIFDITLYLLKTLIAYLQSGHHDFESITYLLFLIILTALDIVLLVFCFLFSRRYSVSIPISYSCLQRINSCEENLCSNTPASVPPSHSSFVFFLRYQFRRRGDRRAVFSEKL